MQNYLNTVFHGKRVIKHPPCIVDEMKVCGLQNFNYNTEINKKLIFHHRLSHIVIKVQQEQERLRYT